jgi:hypothetical protein
MLVVDQGDNKAEDVPNFLHSKELGNKQKVSV